MDRIQAHCLSLTVDLSTSMRGCAIIGLWIFNRYLLEGVVEDLWIEVDGLVGEKVVHSALGY